MMTIKKTMLSISILCMANFCFAQEGLESLAESFTLVQAQEYAVKNSYTMLNAKSDFELNKLKKNEIRGIGLPQVSGSLDSRWNQRTLFESIFKKQADDGYKDVENNGISRERFDDLTGNAASFFTPNATGTPNANFSNLTTLEQQLVQGTYNASAGGFGSAIGAAFNSPHNGTATLQASQIIFSNDYLVALQASKGVLELSQKNVRRNEVDVKIAVAKAYYNVLVNAKRATLLDANLERIKKLLEDTRALNKVGFVEAIDVDRLQVAYNNLLSEKEKIKALLKLGENVLKFQMNYDLNKNIALTDTVTDNVDVALVVSEKVDYGQRSDYALLKQSEVLLKLDYKRYKFSFLPTLVAYGQLQYQAFGQQQKFDFYKGSPWYRATAIGATLSVPIFSGGQKYYRAEQARIELQKTQTTLKTLESAINFENSTAKINYENAAITLINQKKNIELAENVFTVSKKKYEQGVGSNLEVLNAQTALKESQTNYLSAIYDLYIAKLDIEKAQGTIK